MLCPAATPLDGPPVTGPSVICGVIRNDQKRDTLSIQAQEIGALVTEKKDPSSYAGFCTGSYERCPIWRAERHRLWREGSRLRADVA